MTWGFIYLACMLVGLVLAAVSGLLGDLKALFENHPVAPTPDHRPAAINVVGRRVAAGLCAFGGTGLLLATRGPAHLGQSLVFAAVAGLVAVAASLVLLRRRPARTSRPGVAVVVREIPPGGYGQIRLPEHAGGLLMAAQTDDPQPIPAGAEVEVVDMERTVVLVRLPRT